MTNRKESFHTRQCPDKIQAEIKEKPIDKLKLE